MSPSTISVDVGRPILPQLRDLLVSLLEAPYSAFVSNLLLITLACVFIVSGLMIHWITSHPDEFQQIIAAWRRRPRVRLTEKYIQQAIAFLLRRFDTAGAYGLSFTMTLAALSAGVWFFGSALEDIFAYNGTALFDAPVARFFAFHRTPSLLLAMRIASIPGSGCAMIVVAVGSAAYLRTRIHNWRPLGLLFAAIAGAAALDLAVELLVGRAGPPAAWLAPPVGFCGAQPGLTVISVYYGVIASLFAENQTSWRAKVFIWSAALFITLCVGAAYIYLGTVWLTDALSRWALALLWLSAVLVFIAIVERPNGASVALAVKPGPQPLVAEETLLEPSFAATPRHAKVSIDGLNETDVVERRRRGEVNAVTEQSSRTIIDILKDNIFTRFNALLGSLFVTILLISGKQDALFGLVLIANTAIGITQELRAKKTLDRLRVLVAPRASVIREGIIRDLPVGQIVVDDVLEIRPGDQLPIDGVLLAAENLEVNESLLTGEADSVPKTLGDPALSGSFVVAGHGRVQAIRVGEACYARRLARAARRFSLSRSKLRDGVNDILRYVTWALIPTAATLFITQILYSPAGAQDAAVASIAGVVGMVPEGLVLLTSTVMALAVVRLASLGALIQELAAVELLARVDVVCADKTGTLTEGSITLERIIPIGVASGDVQPHIPAEVQGALGAFGYNEESRTASSVALRAASPPPIGEEWRVIASIPFSSARKWGGLGFADHGSWFLGAPEIVLRSSNRAGELLAIVDELARKGKRVMALASSKEPLRSGTAVLPRCAEPEALIVLGEKVRSDVAETLAYFEEQGITVKVVSGDHAETVQAVANLAGIRSGQSTLDARNLPADPREFGEVIDQNNLIGRVMPTQKRQIVQALQDRGHVVAMIGDGVNDVLAIKKADFGIALGSGTVASRAVAQLILLKDNFSALPAVVAEGRRVIANVERTANLFVTKTVYVFALALAIGVAQAPFPFLPRHLTLVGFLTIGAPGFFLSFARNTTLARPGFVSRVLHFAVPAGALAAAATLLNYAAARVLVPDDIELARTAATLALVGCGLVILLLLARPRSIGQWFFLAAIPALLVVILAFPLFRGFFALDLLPLSAWMTTIIIVGVAAIGMLMTIRALVWRG